MSAQRRLRGFLLATPLGALSAQFEASKAAVGYRPQNVNSAHAPRRAD